MRIKASILAAVIFIATAASASAFGAWSCNAYSNTNATCHYTGSTDAGLQYTCDATLYNYGNGWQVSSMNCQAL